MTLQKAKTQPSTSHIAVNASSSDGGVLSVGYGQWKYLDQMMQALEDNEVDYLIDTRHGKRNQYSHQTLAASAQRVSGDDADPIQVVSAPELTGKPLFSGEFNSRGQADYLAMDERPEANKILDRIEAAAREGKRFAIMCSCGDVCECHRTRWLSESLFGRGVEVGHLEPGQWQRDDYEDGTTEKWKITPHRDVRENLPTHSDTNWRAKMANRRLPHRPQKRKATGNQPTSEQPDTKPRQAVAPSPDKPAQDVPDPAASGDSKQKQRDDHQQTSQSDYQSPAAPNRPIPEHPDVILISGNHDANNAQLNYASQLVVRAAETGAQIRVGDSTKGVDQRVVDTAKAIGYKRVQVWTPNDEPRNGGVPGGEVIQAVPNRKVDMNRYKQRDQAMINSMPEDNSLSIFLSNGRTHYKNGRMTGTEAGYIHAVERDLPVHKLAYDQPEHRSVELDPLPDSFTPDEAARASRRAATPVSPDLPVDEDVSDPDLFDDVKQALPDEKPDRLPPAAQVMEQMGLDVENLDDNPPAVHEDSGKAAWVGIYLDEDAPTSEYGVVSLIVFDPNDDEQSVQLSAVAATSEIGAAEIAGDLLEQAQNFEDVDQLVNAAHELQQEHEPAVSHEMER